MRTQEPSPINQIEIKERDINDALKGKDPHPGCENIRDLLRQSLANGKPHIILEEYSGHKRELTKEDLRAYLGE